MKIKSIISLLFITCFLNAQDVLNIDVNEVVISSNRAQNQKNITNIQIISLKEIENAPVQSIEDLLEYAMNVDIRQRGRQGVQSDISIRGGSFEQVLIMLNGIKLNDPQTGHHNLNLPISLEQIEKIEREKKLQLEVATNQLKVSYSNSPLRRELQSKIQLISKWSKIFEKS